MFVAIYNDMNEENSLLQGGGTGGDPYLDHLGVETLTHLRPTMGQQHRTVGVDVNQSSGLQTNHNSESRMFPELL